MLVHLVDDAAADIVARDEPIHSNLFLDAQVPLVDVGRFRILWDHRVNTCRWKDDILTNGNRKRISSRIALPRIIKSASRICKLNQAAPGRRVPDSTNALEVRVIIKYSVSCPNYRHAVALRIPCQSRARREVQPGRRMLGIADV